jgi:glutamine synthetase
MTVEKAVSYDNLKADSIKSVMQDLESKGVKFVRLAYSDMHGYPRGKDIPLEYFESVAEKGQCFCAANLVDGLASNPLIAPGMAPERGYPDMHVIPDLSTLVPIPWEPDTVQCLADIYDEDGNLAEISPRNFLKRVINLFKTELKLTPVFAHELEFYLLKNANGKWEKYSDHLSMVYTVGTRSDEQRILRHFLEAGNAMGLRLTAANHEIGGGQFEVNMMHGEALDAADRAFRFKHMIKEIAHSQGLHATFMGKPFNEEPGSGFHVHMSLVNEEGQNVFYDPSEKDQLSSTFKHFIGGLIDHAPALMLFLAPTVNSYKRMVPGSLVPLHANWGYDNRTTFIRVPGDRGAGTRLELRAGEASANPYLVSAAILLAGYCGLKYKKDPGSPIVGDGSGIGTALPDDLDKSIAALLADSTMCGLIGAPMVNAFTGMKRVESDRFRKFVTDWEFNEYVYHL